MPVELSLDGQFMVCSFPFLISPIEGGWRWKGGGGRLRLLGACL